MPRKFTVIPASKVINGIEIFDVLRGEKNVGAKRELRKKLGDDAEPFIMAGCEREAIDKIESKEVKEEENKLNKKGKKECRK